MNLENITMEELSKKTLPELRDMAKALNIKSVTNLAYILCLPRESVSRSLKHLILEGYISKKNNQITIL